MPSPTCGPPRSSLAGLVGRPVAMLHGFVATHKRKSAEPRRFCGECGFQATLALDRRILALIWKTSSFCIATTDMIERLRQLFRPSEEIRPASVPAGERVYAIGDIHGRLDLLERIAQAIEQDDAARGAADTTIILLGDLIDRGPDSAAVIAWTRAWQQRRKIRILGGNHEEVFLQSFDKLAAFKAFLRIGGRETVLSYGVDPQAWQRAELEEAQAMMIEAVPMEDREYLQGFETIIRIGDYLFVHAGINPALGIEHQLGHDCRWIREPFLSHRGDFGCIVVHGHTVTDEAVFRPNRIGIDTGAFISGKLTAIGLEGSERWLIQTQEEAGSIETFARAA